MVHMYAEHRMSGQVVDTANFVAHMQSSGLPRRLEALKEAVVEEMKQAEHASKDYLRELLHLIEQTQERLAERFDALRERGARPATDEL